MQYGNITISQEELYLYMGFDSANSNASLVLENSPFLEKMEAKAINQRDADLLYMWQKYKKSKEDSPEGLTAQTQLLMFMAHRMHVDKSVKLVGSLLFGPEKGPAVFKAVNLGRTFIKKKEKKKKRRMWKRFRIRRNTRSGPCFFLLKHLLLVFCNLLY
jgi:hypothetical protein